jgi:sulfhydrogenase subunit beta (sulfur reductase)
MKTNIYTVKKDNREKFLTLLCEGREVYTHSRIKDGYTLVRADAWNPEIHTLGDYRPIEPLKTLFFPPREKVASGINISVKPNIKPRIVIGVKNCDLSSLEIHDHVYLNTDPVDPFYAEAREKTVIVSSDCLSSRDVCFCPAVNEQPYAKKGFDINISPVDDTYLVECGSEKGRELLQKTKALLENAEPALIAQRDEQRNQLTATICKNTQKTGLSCNADLYSAVSNSRDSKLWGEFAKDCVECGACNFVCCTCHCFILADGSTKNRIAARVKEWDACLYRNFARVAGGGNPRKHRAERLYNRFDKKFNYFTGELNRYACDGCGRCIEACTGNIDIRKVLSQAVCETRKDDS